MKTLLKIADIIQEWRFVAQEYCQNKENLPLRVIIKNCKEKMHAEIFNIILSSENQVILVTNYGKLIINENNQWTLHLGQTVNRKTIFTKNLNEKERE